MPNSPGQVPVREEPAGRAKYRQLAEAGYSAQELQSWQAGENQRLADAGFTAPELQRYWGVNGPPSDNEVTRQVQRNVAENPPRPAATPLEYFAAGWQNSALGLLLRGKMPDVVNPGGEQTDLGEGLSAAGGQMLGDLPFSIIGATLGGAAGAEVPGPAQVRAVAGAAGVGFGAAAAPEAVRQTAMVVYRRGEARDWKDILMMSFQGAKEVAVQGAIGSVSNIVGGETTRRVLGATARPLLAELSGTVANATTYTAVAGAVHGELPSSQDFITGTIVALGAHAGTKINGVWKPSEAGRTVEHNLQEIYEDTGVPPWKIMERAQQDPHLMQELLTQDIAGRSAAPSIREIAAVDQPSRPGAGRLPALQRPHAPRDIASTLDLLQGLEGSAAAARRAGIPENLVRSPKGAIGRYQIMPNTARQYGFDPARLTEPAYNREVAMRIVTDLYRRFDGDQELIAIAYNAGPGKVRTFLRAGRDRSVLPRETRKYLAHLDTLVGENGWVGSPASLRDAQMGGPDEGAAARTRTEPNTNPLADAQAAERDAKSDAAMTASEAHGRLQEMIGENSRGESLLSPDRLYRQIFSELGPARQIDDLLVAQGLDRAKDVTVEDSFRQTYASDARAGAFVRFGIVDGMTNEVRPGSPSIMDAAKTVKKAGGTLEHWQTYMLGQRTLDLAGRGIQSGFDPEASLAVVSDKSEAVKYAEGTATLNRVLTGGLEYGRDKGLFSQEQVDAMVEANPVYVSMKRVSDAQASTGGKGKGFKARDPLRRIEGSDTQVVDPLSATIANLHNIVAEADKNAATGYLLELAQRGFVKDNIRRVAEEPAVPIREPAPQMREAGGAFNYPIETPAGSVQRGNITGTTDGKTYKVSIAAAPKAGRNQGRGTEAYVNLAREVIAKGGVLESDRSVTPAAQRVYTKLKERGFTVERNPDATVAKGGTLVDETSPKGWVYRVTAAPEVNLKPGTAVENILARPSMGSGLKENQFTYFRDGVREVWEATDPTLAQLIRGADHQGEANIIMKTFETFAGLQRAGIVFDPDFPFRTGFEGAMTAFVADPLHPLPIVTWFKGISDVLGQTDTYQRWVTNGGAGAALADMDAKYIRRDFHQLMSSTGAADRLWNTVKHPLEALQLLTSRVEAAARVGYFKTAEAKGLTPAKAAVRSRTAYIDFAEKGTLALVQSWAKIVPFFRPFLLGTKQVALAFRERPVSTTAYAFMAVTAPQITLYLLNQMQDQDPNMPESRKYRNIPQWKRDNYFIFPEVAGIRIKLAMPRLLAAPFATMPVRFMEYLRTSDPAAFKGMMENWLKNALPSTMPTFTAPVLEQMTNHSFFTGEKLIPAALEEVSGDMQYTRATTEIGKAVSRWLGPSQGIGAANVSPIVLENYVRGWTGTIGWQVLKALDAPLKHSGKPGELGDNPFIDGFVMRNPGMSAEPIQQFYDHMNEFKRAHADFELAMKRTQTGQSLDMSEIDAKGADPRAFVNLAAVSDALRMQQTVIQAIENNDAMTVDEKRQSIERAYGDMILTARLGLSSMDDIEHLRSARHGRPLNGAASSEETGQVAPPADLDINALAGVAP